jgi:Surface glycan-binding protein B xyloglucan binding domain/IPT/TIG domain
MNTIAFHISKRAIFLLVIIAGIFPVACKKNNGGPPVITDVRAVDSTKRDSTFSSALPGTLIVIQGNNMQGLQAVYFNDTAATFNPVMATGTNIIVTIPATAQTAATAKVPSQIRIVTNHGTATYSFTLYIPPPTISALSFDNTGTILTITGTNLLGASKITFPGNLVSPSFTINSATQITATIPPGNTPQDSVRVYCTFGTASFSYPPPMTISSVSNENGTAGTTILVNGSNFVGVTSVVFPGGIPGTNLQVLNISQLTVTVPAGVTTGDSLRLVGALGTAASPFVYDNWLSPTVGFLANFDGTTSQWSPPANNPYFGWSQGEQWTGTYITDPTVFPNGTGNCVEINPANPKPAGDNTWYQDNNSFSTNTTTWVSGTNTPIGNYVLKFEVNVTNWTAGSIWIGTTFPNWAYLAQYAPWKTIAGGSYSSNGWVTVTIPLTGFLAATNNVYTSTGAPAPDIPTLLGSGGGMLQFMYANDGTKTIPGGSFVMAFDNIRIVPIK